MCCEATDALLEYVRRSLGLTGLRNLNAPRRLKLRVPVLKEWLQRQGRQELAASIPDWDPVRRPTGRWKSWEMAHLKPIMDEKAVERQAKRALVGGETVKASIAAAQLTRADTEENRNEAVQALTAMGGYQPVAGTGGDDEPDSSAVVGDDSSGLVVIYDDAGEEAAAAVNDANAEYGPQTATAAEGVQAAISRIAAIRHLFSRYEPMTDSQATTLAAALTAIDGLTHHLSESCAELSQCELKAGAAPGGWACMPAPPDAAAAALSASESSHRSQFMGSGSSALDMMAEASSQEKEQQVMLEMGASQVSLDGFMCHSQESTGSGAEASQESVRGGGGCGTADGAEEPLSHSTVDAVMPKEEAPDGGCAGMEVCDDLDKVRPRHGALRQQQQPGARVRDDWVDEGGGDEPGAKRARRVNEGVKEESPPEELMTSQEGIKALELIGSQAVAQATVC